MPEHESDPLIELTTTVGLKRAVRASRIREVTIRAGKKAKVAIKVNYGCFAGDEKIEVMETYEAIVAAVNAARG